MHSALNSSSKKGTIPQGNAPIKIPTLCRLARLSLSYNLDYLLITKKVTHEGYFKNIMNYLASIAGKIFHCIHRFRQFKIKKRVLKPFSTIFPFPSQVVENRTLKEGKLERIRSKTLPGPCILRVFYLWIR